MEFFLKFLEFVQRCSNIKLIIKNYEDIPLPIISLLRGDEDDVEGVNPIKTTTSEGSESEKKIIKLGNLIYYFNLLCIENFFVRKL